MRERAGSVEENLHTANAERSYQVTEDDLPLHCPMPQTYLWNSHPKVYLPMASGGEAKCPYCGASYELVADSRP